MTNKLGYSWLTLTALVSAGALLGSSGAPASCATMRAAMECATACNCCSGPESRSPTHYAADFAAVRSHLSSSLREVCRNSGDECTCRSQIPVSTAPKQLRVGRDRTDSRLIGPPSQFDLGSDSAPISLSIVATNSPPQKLPIYLRISRLLI
jgi:hypothetical protein